MATTKQLRQRVHNLEYLTKVPHENMDKKGTSELLDRINFLMNLTENNDK